METSDIISIMNKVVDLEKYVKTFVQQLKEDIEDESIAKTQTIGYLNILLKQLDTFEENEFKLLFREDLITINEKTSNDDTSEDNTNTTDGVTDNT